MRRLRKLLAMPLADQVLLLKAGALLMIVRAALRLFTFQRVRNTLSRYGATGRETMPNAKIIWAVDTMSYYLFPNKPCLTRALVAQMLLSRNGYKTTLRIGVARTPNGELQAHAWLEDQGKLVMGYLRNMAQFTPLPPLENLNS